MKTPPLTASQIAPLLGLPSGDSVRKLAARRILPQIRISYKCRRYDLSECQKALEKRVVRAI